MNEHGDISWKDLEGGDERRGCSRSPKRAPEAKDDKDAVGEDKTDYEGLIRSLPDPASPLEVIQACSSLGVGLTSLAAAVKSTNERSLEVLQDQQRSWQELARALDVMSTAIQRQATAVESLSAGVGYNTSRVGAVTGRSRKSGSGLSGFPQNRWMTSTSKAPSCQRSHRVSEVHLQKGTRLTLCLPLSQRLQ